MAVEAKTEPPLIKELGTAQKKLSPFIYFGLLPLLLLIVAMLFAGLANSTVIAATDSPEVRVGSELEFPPYAFVDEGGRPAGFSVDLIKAVADVMGLSIKISTGPWDTMWKELVAGRLDVLPIVAKSPERQRLVDFSLPHTETYDAFFVRQGNPQIQNIEAARGMEIVVMRSDAAHHALLERNFQGRLILVETIPAGLSLISSGKHDAFLCSKLIGSMVIKERGLKNLDAGPPIPDYKRVFSFAVKKGDVDLLEQLNQGLLIIKTNHEYDRIYEKWLTAEEPWRKLQKYLWPAIVIAIAIALIVGFWLIMLQLLVKKRTRQLSKSNEMLRLAREGLEEKVAQRTIDLANANISLQNEITERKRSEERIKKLNEDLIGHVKQVEIANQQLNRAIEELARSNRDLEEFAYVASHDLQEPLRKIANFSEMLAHKYRGHLDEQADRYFGYISDGAKRMQALINDLLAYSRISSADFQLMEASLEDVLQAALTDLQTLIRENKAEISHDTLPSLKVNPIQLRRLFQNLINNGIKFHDVHPPRIHISARQDPGEWVISVRDNGIGFDPQYAKQIFKVFKRLHAKEVYPGTGIGLAICKKIVERHGGSIWAESGPGRGSTFYFTIPM